MEILQILRDFQQIKPVTACLNAQFKGFSMENQQLGDTPMPFFFPETPPKRNMSKEQITEVIRILTKILENVNIEFNELMAETKGRFESIKNHMMNLVKDHKGFKKWKTKSNNHNERRLNEKENDELKKKILELETSLKEKEQVINSIIESKQR